jgi:hypothetical protein
VILEGYHYGLVTIENFAGEVFIEAPCTPPRRCALCDNAVQPDRLRLIEIEQHCRMVFDCGQHIAELAQQMRTDRLELECTSQANDRDLKDRDGEMIGPEMDHPFDEGRICSQRRRRAGTNCRDILVTQGFVESGNFCSLRAFRRRSHLRALV